MQCAVCDVWFAVCGEDRGVCVCVCEYRHANPLLPPLLPRRYRRDVWACRLTIAAGACVAVGAAVAVGWWVTAAEKHDKAAAHAAAAAAAAATVAPSTAPSTAGKEGFSLFRGKPTEGAGAAAPAFAAAATPAPGTTTAAVAAATGAIVTSPTGATAAAAAAPWTWRWVKGTLTTAVGGAAAVLGIHVHQQGWLERRAAELLSEPCLHEAYHKSHARAVADKDEHAKALWRKVRFNPPPP